MWLFPDIPRRHNLRTNSDPLDLIIFLPLFHFRPWAFSVQLYHRFYLLGLRSTALHFVLLWFFWSALPMLQRNFLFCFVFLMRWVEHLSLSIRKYIECSLLFDSQIEAKHLLMFTGIFKMKSENTYCILKTSSDVNVKKVTVMIQSVTLRVTMPQRKIMHTLGLSCFLFVHVFR